MSDRPSQKASWLLKIPRGLSQIFLSAIVDLIVYNFRLPGFHTTVALGGDCQDEKWYKDNGIRWIGKTKVESIDFQGRVLKCDNGSEFTYDKLILATGAEVRVQYNSPTFFFPPSLNS